MFLYLYWLSRQGWNVVDHKRVLETLYTALLKQEFTEIPEIVEFITMMCAVTHSDLIATNPSWPTPHEASEALKGGVDALATLERFAISPHADKSDLFMTVVGSIYSIHCKTKLNRVTVQYLEPITDKDVIRRFRIIVKNYAAKCTYERSGDAYIHYLLRSKLTSARNCTTMSTPYDSISDQYGDGANDLVRPYIEVSPGVKEQNVHWGDTIVIDDFHFIVSLIRELCDGCSIPIGINSSLTQYLHRVCPTLFCFTSDYEDIMGKTYGFCSDGYLFVPAKADPRPLLTCLIWFVTRASQQLDAVQELHTALYRPEELGATSPFSVLLEG